MRFLVYVVAVLAAAGIVYYVSGTAEKPVAGSGDNVAEVAAVEGEGGEQQVTAAPVVEGEIHLVNLKVPSMHCPFACYPSVKETLEAEAGVAEVELVQQQEEGVIDNPVVTIKAGDNFDLDKAITTLASAGFDGASVVE